MSCHIEVILLMRFMSRCMFRFDVDFVTESIHNAAFLVYTKADRAAGAR